MVIDKVAVLIAAGTGMGAETAKKLASEGFKVSILSSSGKGETLAKELGGFGVTGSNQSKVDIKKLIDGTIDRWGRVDVLVNSAGHGPKGPILDISDEEWYKGMDTYFMNVVHAAQLVAPVMQSQGSGVIINISTFAAFEPDPTFPTSVIFRSALAAFTKLFADEYASKNIRMNNILPGFINSKGLPEKEEVKSRIPLNRYGTTEEIASLVSFLASDGAAYITGQNIRVDGGITRSV